MLVLHLVISALIAVLSVVIVCIAHSKVVEHDIEELKKNPILIEARHHSYIPLFVSVELDEDEYEDFDLISMLRKLRRLAKGNCRTVSIEFCGGLTSQVLSLITRLTNYLTQQEQEQQGNILLHLNRRICQH